MDPQTVLLGTTFPLALVLTRLLQMAPGMVSDLLRHLSNLITLRMTLRDAAPAQRAELLAAHKAWRNDLVPAVSPRPRERHPENRVRAGSEPPRRATPDNEA